MGSRVGFLTNIFKSWESHTWAGHVGAMKQAQSTSSKQICKSVHPIKLKGGERYGCSSTTGVVQTVVPP